MGTATPASHREPPDARAVAFADLIRLRHRQTTDDGSDKPTDAEYQEAVERFRSAHRGRRAAAGYRVELAIFGRCACGVWLAPDGEVWYTVIERAIGFDWSEAQQLLHRVDRTARQSRELWRLPPRTDQECTACDEGQDAPVLADRTGSHLYRWRAGRRASRDQRRCERYRRRRAWEDCNTGIRGWRRRARERAVLIERRRHGERAYDIATSILSAVNLETTNRSEVPSNGDSSGLAERLRRHLCANGRESGQPSRKPSESFLARVALIRPQVADAERVFRTAAQRHAQVRYAHGMVIGVCLLAAVTVGLAIAFNEHHVPAFYGVGVVSGGVGALVSVLQRMASGRLRLDFNAGNGMTMALGAVRPLIGAIFGVVVFAVFDGRWLPEIQIEHTKPLAFYTVLGFLAGFNERFAQDMLVGSARQLSGAAPQTSESGREGGVEAPVARAA